MLFLFWWPHHTDHRKWSSWHAWLQYGSSYPPCLCFHTGIQRNTRHHSEYLLTFCCQWYYPVLEFIFSLFTFTKIESEKDQNLWWRKLWVCKAFLVGQTYWQIVHTTPPVFTCLASMWHFILCFTWVIKSQFVHWKFFPSIFTIILSISSSRS